jgi:uncharacterized protein
LKKGELKKKKLTPYISALTLFPIKGCQGLDLTEAFACKEGLAVKLANGNMLHDRQFMVVDSQGQFITQREVPFLATISVSLTVDGFCLSAPGHPKLDIPVANESRRARNVVVWNFSGSGLDVGPLAVGWFTKVLGRPAALVQFNQRAPRQCKEIGSVASNTFFADSFGYLVVSQASVLNLQLRMQEHHQDTNLLLPTNRFRANVLIDGVEAFEEDLMRSLDFGNASLEVVSKCVRCNVPGVDQTSGEVQVEQPTPVLDTYRLDVELGGSTIGVNAIYLPHQISPDGPQIIKTGQKLEIEYDF